jgi:hypothetical protein
MIEGYLKDVAHVEAVVLDVVSFPYNILTLFGDMTDSSLRGFLHGSEYISDRC